MGCGSERAWPRSGWTPGPDGVRARDGAPLAFTLITQSGFAIRENVAQAIQKQFKDVGVAMDIKLIDGTSISSTWFSGNFDAMLHWWQQPADPEITLFFAADRTPPAGRNINYLDDRDLTALLYQSDRTADQAQRAVLLKRAQRRIADQHIVGRSLAVTAVDAETGGSVALRIEVDDENALADRSQRRAEVDRGRGLADAALLVRDG